MLAAFGEEHAPTPDLDRWREIGRILRHPEGEVTIAIVGKYTGLKDAYKSLTEALQHGGIANKVRVNLDWIESEIFEKEDPAPYLDGVNGILVPGGFGERGTEGKINAVTFARQRNVPFFGICFGMQMAVIEAARHLGGISSASSSEFGETARAGGRASDGMAEGKRAGETACARRSRRHDASRRLSGDPQQRQPHRGDIRRHRDQGAPPPPLRGEHRLQGATGGAGMSFSGMSPDNLLPETIELPGPPLVHRRAVSSGAEITPVRTASALRELHRRCGGAEQAGVSVC